MRTDLNARICELSWNRRFKTKPSSSNVIQCRYCEVHMKFIFVLTMFFAFNAEASDPPKADGKKAERSAVPERITRPKPSPDSLPQQVEKNSNPNACPKFEYKDKPAKIVCLEKATGNDKPKPAAK